MLKTAVLYSLYSLGIMFTGLWGHFILPKECTSKSLASFLRTTIVSGAVIFVAFIALGMCSTSCGLNMKQNPMSLLVFTLVASFISLIGQIGAMAQFNKDENKVCRSSKSYSTYKGLSILILTLTIIVIGYICFQIKTRYSSVYSIQSEIEKMQN